MSKLLEKLLKQAEQLSPEEQVQLIEHLTQILHLIREKSKPLSFNQGLTVSN
jgi:hypothetical protein